MAKRDYMTFDRYYWKDWAEQNRNYWSRWAEHNQAFWNNPQAYRYTRHCGRGSILGKIIIFGLGFWAGHHVNQRYHVPSANPREVRVEIKTSAENLKKDNPNFQESSELRDIIDKVKQLEKKYRRSQPVDESKPSVPGSSGPKSSE